MEYEATSGYGADALYRAMPIPAPIKVDNRAYALGALEFWPLAAKRLEPLGVDPALAPIHYAAVVFAEGYAAALGV